MQTRHILGAAGGTAGAILSTCGLVALAASLLTNGILLCLFIPLFIFLGVHSYQDNKNEKLSLKKKLDDAETGLIDITLDYILLLIKAYMFQKNSKRVGNINEIANYITYHLSVAHLAIDKPTVIKMVTRFQKHIDVCDIKINDDFTAVPHRNPSETCVKDSLRSKFHASDFVVKPPPVVPSLANKIRRGLVGFLNGYGCFAGPCAGTLGVIGTIVGASLLALFPPLLPIIISVSIVCGIAVAVSANSSYEKKMRMRQLTGHYQTVSRAIEHKSHEQEKTLERQIGYKQGLKRANPCLKYNMCQKITGFFGRRSSPESQAGGTAHEPEPPPTLSII